MNTKNAPTAKEYIAKARELYEVEGEVEIDCLDETEQEAEARISRSEDSTGEMGAYVKAWVWVGREELQPDYTELFGCTCGEEVPMDEKDEHIATCSGKSK